MKLSSLFNGLPMTTNANNWQNINADGVSADSRTLKRGDVYVVLKGENFNGLEFVDQVIKKGACAIISQEDIKTKLPVFIVKNARKALSILASRYYGDPSKKLKLIGVTGTNGKTTITHMLASIFSASGKKTGVIGTLGAKFCGREISSSFTTPDPVEFQFILSQMVDEGVEYCFAEISAHALYFQKECACRYRGIVFTNLTQDHLDFFHTMEEYANAKCILLNEREHEYAIVNGDDPVFHKMLASNDIITYGIDCPSDNFAIIQKETISGQKVVFNLNDDLCECELTMIGKYNVLNALAAASVAQKEGISLEWIAKGLKQLQGVEGRLERVGEFSGGSIFVDFAHTPDGLEKSLSTLKKQCLGKLYCLFGCGGNRDRTKRPIMGAVAGKIADGVIITSDNPRYEDPFEIIKEIEVGVPESTPCVAIEDRAEAIVYAISLLKKGDILLVAGKGAEKYQECMGIKREYSDYNVIKKVLQ